MILACQADVATMVRRLEKRGQRRADPSDADVAILAQQHQLTEPLDAEERADTLALDTTNPKALHYALAAIRRRLNIDAA
jgi:predicted kinase